MATALILIAADVDQRGRLRALVDRTAGEFSARVAADVEGALEIAEQECVGAVVVDIDSPWSLEWVNAILSFQAVHLDVPIVAVGDSRAETIDAHLPSLGFGKPGPGTIAVDDFVDRQDLSGPLLLQSVRHAIERKRLIKALAQSERRNRELDDLVIERTRELEETRLNRR